MKKIFFILFLIFININCYAAGWEEMYTKNYADISSIERKKDIVTVWVKRLNDGNFEPVNSKKIWFVLEKFETDCKKKRFNILSYNYYDLRGNLIESHNYSNRMWTNILPGTTGEYENTLLCSATEILKK